MTRMLAEHQAQIKRMNENHEDKVKQVENDAKTAEAERLREQKEQMTERYEHMLEAERKKFSESYKGMMEQQNGEFTRLHKQMSENFLSEKTTTEELLRKQGLEYEERIRKMQCDHEVACKRKAIELEDFKREADIHAQNMLRRFRDEVDLEKERWMTDQLEKQKEEIQIKTKEIRTALEKERDLKIKHVISKLGEEHVVTAKKAEESAQEKIQTETKRYEQSDRQLKAKISVLKSDLKSREIEIDSLNGQLEQARQKTRDLEGIIEQKDREIEYRMQNTKNVKEELDNERKYVDSKVEEARQQEQRNMSKLEDEIRRQKKKRNDAKEKFAVELERK